MVCQVCCWEGTRQPVFSSLCLEHCWCLSVCRHMMAVPSQHWCCTRTCNVWTVLTVQDPVCWQPSFLSKNRFFLWLVRSKVLFPVLFNLFTDSKKSQVFSLALRYVWGPNKWSYPAYLHIFIKDTWCKCKEKCIGTWKKYYIWCIEARNKYWLAKFGGYCKAQHTSATWGGLPVGGDI